MDDDKLRARIGSNIAVFRKRAGLTQAGLAEKLNYSDKAVSKWERGDSLPDVLTMLHLAEILDTDIKLLLAATDLPEVSEEEPEKRRASKPVILGLSTTLVWFVALFVFVVVSSLDIPGSWVTFFYAIPVNAIVLLSLRSAWRQFSWNKVLISLIVWGCLLSAYVTGMVLFARNDWKVLLLGIPGQIAVSLWFRMFAEKKNEPVQEEASNG